MEGALPSSTPSFFALFSQFALEVDSLDVSVQICSAFMGH